jgi:hypothetical protein
MTELKITPPTVGEKNSVADPQTQVALETIRNFLNGEQITSGNIKEHGIEESRLSEALIKRLGEAVTVGIWTPLESVSGKLEEVGAPQQTVRARAELGLNVCRLRGSLKIKTGETVQSFERFATLPATLRPPGTVELSVNLNKVATGFVINAAGEISLTDGLGAPNVIKLDGQTFNLT